MLLKEFPNSKSQLEDSLSPKNTVKMLPKRFSALITKNVVLRQRNGSVNILITMHSEADGKKHGNTGMSLARVRLMPLEAQSCSDIYVFHLVASISNENIDIRWSKLFKF